MGRLLGGEICLGGGDEQTAEELVGEDAAAGCETDDGAVLHEEVVSDGLAEDGFETGCEVAELLPQRREGDARVKAKSEEEGLLKGLIGGKEVRDRTRRR